MTHKKELAITLRKKGYSYSEILKDIPVAKSTLSLWLRSVGLAKQQKQKITEKRLAGALRGAKSRRDYRLKITEDIKNKAAKEIGNINERDLWLIGISLYWAEGTKERECGKNSGIIFTNSDPRMILLFLKWLRTYFLIDRSEIIYEIYIHETANIESAKIYWSKILSISTEEIRVYLKKNRIKTIRNNTSNTYYGLIKVKAKKSTNLNRKIAGWINGIYCGVV